MTSPILVSACLCGYPVRYDGGSCRREEVVRLLLEGRAIAFCPECAGGLPTPRPPCECQPDGRVLSCGGCDCTAAYRAGAARALALCRTYAIRQAILKERSPSCGVQAIYDGGFAGTVIPGAGMTTRLLRKHGIAVYSEDHFDFSQF